MEGGCTKTGKINSRYKKKDACRFATDRLSNPQAECKDIPTLRYSTPQYKDYLDKYIVNGRHVVRKITIELFQERLIKHFDILFKKNTVKWHKGNKTKSVV